MIAHFIVYIMAMVGIFVLAIYTYKMTYGKASLGLKSSMLSVTDTMKLTPKKTLYVVKAGEERFLIASDFDSTTLISKLDGKEPRCNNSNKLSSPDGIQSIQEFMAKTERKNTAKQPVFKELARKLQNC